MTAIPKRDVRAPKPPALSASQNTSKAPSNVCGSDTIAPTGRTHTQRQVFCRGTLPPSCQRGLRQMTSLDGPETSSSRALQRSILCVQRFRTCQQEKFFRLRTLGHRCSKTGDDFANPRFRSTVTTCLVSASNSPLPDVGSHRITRFKNDAFIEVLPSEWNFPVHIPSYPENKTLSNHFSS